MNVTKSCNHTHSVRVDLAEDETWVRPSSYRGGKPLLVTGVNATAQADGTDVFVKLGGWYAKKDGTASQVRPSYPERVDLDDLPKPVQDAINAALGFMAEACRG